MRQISSALRTAWSVLALNLGWFACVLGSTRGATWLSVVIVLLLGAIHVLVIGKENLLPAIFLGMASLPVGFVLDTLLIVVGAYDPNRWLMPPPFTTIWLLMLWLNFSFALNESLKWLQEHLLIAAIAGSFFGPLAYLAADRLGAVRIAVPVSSSIVQIGAAWFAAMPVMSLIAKSLYHRPSRFRKR